MLRPTRRYQYLGWKQLQKSSFADVVPDEEEVDKVWEWNRKTSSIIVVTQNLETKFLGETVHLAVAKSDKRTLMFNSAKAWENLIEVDYSEKVAIVNHVVTNHDVLAIEVFPEESKVVKEALLPHIWVCKKSEFPFGMQEASELPEGEEWKEENINGIDIESMIRYVKTMIGYVSYQYIRRKDGKELSWEEKQMIKNETQSPDVLAFEIISKYGVGKATCLVYPPIEFFLDFGHYIK